MSKGNSCGHDRKNPRFCDLARRGKGGQPAVIGLICAQVAKIYTSRKVLSEWQEMNNSGRRRKSEIREACVTVLQYLFSQWFRLDTLTCTFAHDNDYLEVPNLAFIANKISESKEWKASHHRISVDRIQTIVSDLMACNYMVSYQKNQQNTDGTWTPMPAIRMFTEKFFVDLGGQNLWDKVLLAKEHKIESQGGDVKTAETIVTPKIMHFIKQGIIKCAGETWRQLLRLQEEIRASAAYQKRYVQIVEDLYIQHRIDKVKQWSKEVIFAHAKRMTDIEFSIA